MRPRIRTRFFGHAVIVAVAMFAYIPCGITASDDVTQATAPAQPSPNQVTTEPVPVQSSPDQVTTEPVPVQPSPDQAAAEPASAPPPATAEVAHKVILLPVEFTVYERSAGGGREAVPDWTEAARANISASAAAVLQSRAHLELVPMPDLTPDETKVLHEHVGLVRLIVMQGNFFPGGPWQARKADYDRGLGPGLQFLAEKTGAEYAVLLDGAQYKQSGGSVLSQLALAALGVGTGGGGTYLSGSLLDLARGEVSWFNAQTGMEILGMTGSDIRNSGEAQSVLRKLFEPYPTIPALAP